MVERKQDKEKLFEAGRSGLRLLCIHGEKDLQRVSGMAVVDIVREHFKNVEVVEIANSGHAFFYERPEETNRALLAFIRGCRR